MDMVIIKEGVAIVRSVRNGLALGHLCDYCNIMKGWSVVFNSFDEYVNHVVKNHPGLNHVTITKLTWTPLQKELEMNGNNF